MEIWTASFPVVLVWIAVIWTVCTLIALVDMLQAGIRTSIHLHLHPLGELLFFSFYCAREFGVGA